MGWQVEQYSNSKISTNFASRLARLEADQLVRVIVLPVARTDPNPRETGNAMTKQQVEWAFDDIDKQLARTGGHRLTQRGNTLGFIVLEATPASIEAIAELDWVDVIIEDQPIHPVG